MLKTTYSRLFTFIFLSLLFLYPLQNSVAQTETAPKRGVYLNGSYSMSDFETVNNTNGNVMFNLPLASLPAGRGGMSYGISLSYNSKLFDIQTNEFFVPPPSYQGEVKRAKPSETGGWQYGIGYSLEQKKRPVVPEFHSNTQELCHSAANPDYKYFDMYKFVLTLPDGSQKEFTPILNFGGGYYDSANQDGYHSVDINGKYRRWTDIYAFGEWKGCEISYYQYTGTMSFYTTDGSFLRLDVAHDNDTNPANNPWTLSMPDGSRITQAAPLSGEPYGRQKIYDRNNNFVEIQKDISTSNGLLTEVTDELGRKLTVTKNLQTLQDTVSLKGVNNETVSWTIKWKNIYVSRNYWISTDHSTFSTPGTVNAIFKSVEEIVLPAQLGGQSYKFEYNGDSNVNFSTPSTGFGEIARIELPSGAFAEYDYKLDGTPATPEWKDVFLNPLTKKTLSYQETYDGQTSGKTEEWLYDIGWTQSQITAPDGGISKAFYYHLLDDDGYVYQSESPDGTISRRIRVAYGPYAGADLRYLWQGLTAAEYTTIAAANGSPSKTIGKSFDYDMNGNRVRVKEYDWLPVTPTLNQYGEPSGASPIRTTETSYYNPAPEIRQYGTPNLDLTNLYTESTFRKIRNAVKAVEIKNGSGTPVSRAELFYDDAANTGNVTQTRSWDSTKGNLAAADPNTGSKLTTGQSGNSISTTAQYDQYGNPTLTTDAKSNQTQITYGAVNGYSGLYPTQTVAAYGTSIARTSSAAYDFYTGLVTSSTDVDNNLTSATEYDAVGRPLKAKAAVGTSSEVWTQTEYDDVLRRVVTRSDLFTKGDGRKIAVQHSDQLGRVRLSRSIENAATEDPYNEQHGIKVQTRYSISGNYSYQLTSNPYRATTSAAASNEPSMGWTRSKTVNTGRHSETETFTGAALPAPFAVSNANTTTTGKAQTDADADRTLVTDQAGKQRISQMNALGQLINVWEITAADSATSSVSFIQSTAAGYQTSYQYNTLGKLKEVTQGVQKRHFLYDSLGRLLRVRQPEQQVNSALNLSGGETTNTQWSAGFSYDANGNMLTATDAKNVTTTSVYDAMNRITARSYSDAVTPTVNYTYDDANVAYSKGRLTKVSSSISETRYTAYDKMGRLLANEQATNGQTYPSNYKYNLSGVMIEQTYPSGRVVQNFVDADGDLAGISSKTGSGQFKNYASNFSYTATKVIQHLQLGNGLWESAKLNSRQQVTELNLGTSATDGSLWKLNYEYGELNANGTVDGTKNSGNIAKQTVGFSGLAQPFVQTYKYDSVNRITEAKETNNGNQTWMQTFGYDRYGNRTGFSQNVLGQQLAINSQTLPAVDVNTNRFQTGQSYGYDADGNLIQDASGRQFTFDGENKQTEVKDASNNVVGRYYYDGNGKRVKKVTASETTIFVYDGTGKLVAEYSTATPVSNPTTNYTATDPLGSPRVLTNSQGQIISRRDFMPFGEELSPDATYRTANLKYNYSDNIRQKFTGYQRDEETGLDFAEARYYNHAHGRFTAVDPLLASGKSANPQTFNRYAYTMNRPLILTDSTGLQAGQKSEDPPFFPSIKVLQFAVNDRQAAARIGTGGEGTSLSSAAIRFAIRSGLSNELTGRNGETIRGDGTQVNAVRHVVWQATITKELGADTAKKAGDAHEDNPNTTDTSQRNFTGSSENLQNADQTIDLLNNQIGRQIGAANSSATNNEIAQRVIEYYRDTGLYTATINQDGSVSIGQTRISAEQANAAIGAISQLNDNGRNAAEQRRDAEAQNTTVIEEQKRIRRGERPQE